MEKLFLSLTKTKEYCLKPFGKFKIKISPSIGIKRKKNVLDYNTLHSYDIDAMPYTKENEKAFEKYMLKHKTDVLVETNEYSIRTFYTRIGGNFISISHSKLNSYAQFLKERDCEDNEESWKEFMQ